ncbi:TauD/TfdA dioxygenase family protein [Yinghuangia soli]|uniref:Alpha-ketoglutarate-dependent sulfate ester dioxygenase n=1 Tax=Yinghuangia soli TaxID=2908204 RepID=A0AA41Q5B4_9ACTN|nr:TauD/TfdA family dioxygenase [Yinghuangia soli]MCF2531843.1 TauD/TfdA family dioxygenase [Yinghuangia soli]
MTATTLATTPALPDTAEGITVTKVSGRIGAVIGGVRLSGDLDEATVQAVRDALHAHKVIFFRGQDHLTDEAQLEFTRLLGDPIGHPTVNLEGELVLPITSEYGGAADQWHTDVTFVPAYPLASILRAIEIPEAGGHTLWANTAAAYDELSPALKELADSLRAVHTNLYDYAAISPDRDPELIKRYQEIFASTVYETEHPVVRVHPVTGERNLLLGGFVQRLAGYGGDDSKLLIQLLQNHVTRVENTVRWSWQPGDVAIWDNRATQHRAISDFGTAKRVLHRTTVDGDIPVGVDGRSSTAIKPAPATPAQAA